MLNNNIQKNAISKDKLQLSIKKRKLTRQEQINLTSEDRKRIWGTRRSIQHKIQKQRKQTSSPYLSDRKLIKFIVRFSVSLEKKRAASNELYYYNINTSTKRISSDFNHTNLQKKGVYGMSNFATMNVNKILNNESVEPDFVERKKSDNAYYAQSHRLKNVNSTTKSQSPMQTETKNSHQGEMSKPIPSEVSDGLRSIVSRKAVKYWKMGKTQYFVISNAEIFARDFPQAADDWYRYIATAEGKEFMRWVMAYSKKYWDPFSEKIIH